MPADSRTTRSEALSGPDRPRAILLPGLLCDAAIWAGQRAALEALLPCCVPDYGELDSLAAMARQALAAAPPRVLLIGHSMGGRVALEIVRSAPERVIGLALLDSGYQARMADAAGEREARERYALLELARTAGMRQMGRAWLQGMVHPDRLHDGPLVEAILDMIERRTPRVFAAQIRALLERPDATGVLSGLRCPALIACGRQDAWSPVARHERMAALIPDARLEVIEDSGHMAPMERPGPVAQLLAHWARGVLGS